MGGVGGQWVHGGDWGGQPGFTGGGGHWWGLEGFGGIRGASRVCREATSVHVGDWGAGKVYGGGMQGLGTGRVWRGGGLVDTEAFGGIRGASRVCRKVWQAHGEPDGPWVGRLNVWRSGEGPGG